MVEFESDIFQAVSLFQMYIVLVPSHELRVIVVGLAEFIDHIAGVVIFSLQYHQVIPILSEPIVVTDILVVLVYHDCAQILPVSAREFTIGSVVSFITLIFSELLIFQTESFNVIAKLLVPSFKGRFIVLTHQTIHNQVVTQLTQIVDQFSQLISTGTKFWIVIVGVTVRVGVFGARVSIQFTVIMIFLLHQFQSIIVIVQVSDQFCHTFGVYVTSCHEMLKVHFVHCVCMKEVRMSLFASSAEDKTTQSNVFAEFKMFVQ